MAQTGLERLVRDQEVVGSNPIAPTILLMYHLYILQSKSTGKFYIGHAADLEDRLHRHNSNQSKSTKNRGPWMIVYTESFATRSDAQSREYQIKAKKSSDYIRKMIA